MGRRVTDKLYCSMPLNCSQNVRSSIEDMPQPYLYITGSPPSLAVSA